MKFSTGLGFGLGLGAGLGFWCAKVAEERKSEAIAAQKEQFGLNQNDRDYLEEKLEELKKK